MWPLFLSGFFQLKDLLPEGFQGIKKKLHAKNIKELGYDNQVFCTHTTAVMS